MIAGTRQQVLILHLAEPDLGAATVAWALYDGSQPAGDQQMQAGDQPEPPYASVVDAMHDGWRVLQLPQLPTYPRGAEHETGPLPWEYVLERFVSAEAPDDDHDFD
ncbi:MAG: hypothetical protein OXO54_07755 [Chloroflexota bacterium]|nr:hypothetical protein [bacterium]MDE2769197.1 hypothetical protein [Chloroflexota bacterium]MDE2898203.1 hypothetical protein [Chloroflexota bacterium]